jgi:acyl-CoA thioester hydrolase
MPVKDAIERRVSWRAYQPTPVPQDKLMELLEAARLAPSACNQQPWRFTGGSAIAVLQGFVFDVGIGVGRKGPDLADLLVHVSSSDVFASRMCGPSGRLVGMSENVFRWDYRVGYADCTVGNHVYYARYLDLLERARGEFFRNIGKSLADLQQEDTIFPVLECHLKYHAPAGYDDLLTIEVTVTMAKGVRLNFRHRILAQSSQCLVECETFHVRVSIAGKPKRLPREFVDLLGVLLAGG